MNQTNTSRTRGIGLAIVAAAIIALGACTSASEAASSEDRGDFVVRPAELTSDDYTELAAQLSEERWLEDVADVLNESLILPVDIGLRFAECGENNAYYVPDDREIQICIEMFEGERETFAAYFETDEEIEEAVNGSFLFTVFHEVGHALVDVLEIPFTGREEDTADSLAAWWLIDGDDGEESAISGALSFYTDPSEAGDLEESDFADEHSLSQQRYYTLTCLVYGSDPDKYANLLEEEWLTPERAEQCPGEFERLTSTWYTLLDAHLKD
ncbi:DUF4344 domain-containing metallopeptidase [Brevundimonas subvibrioides]|uniref:Metallopeptidase DUF4344 n=1 Tax=Brevundimonas subvibrioides (strain ATCC 15264 / DSM 4735 / LMG 14903 / NBRC 16000 / CB 81) TaxID=633149 RepID=D9QF06_BRESC|nr:DUF4344 domain-containing metallopeptidase [Brevundimonas subvibrioides]ADL00491.1 conserved hypothetical protein [Brevundimonas subvibrioides ATCC 15264]